MRDQVLRLERENRSLEAHANFLDRLLVAATLLLRHRALVQGEPERILAEICRTLSRILEAQRVSVWFLEEDHASLSCACLYDARDDLCSSGVVLHARDYPAYFREVVAGTIVAADDAVTDPRTAAFVLDYLRPLGITSMLDVPIKSGDRVQGVLCHEHTGPRREWTRHEKRFAVFASSLVTLGLELRRVRHGDGSEASGR